MDSNDASGRRKSFDISETWNNKKTALVAEPKQAADIARVFQNVVRDNNIACLLHTRR